MMKINHRQSFCALTRWTTAVLALGLFACNQTPAEKAQKEAERNRERAADQVEKAGERAADQIRDARVGAEAKGDKAGDKVEDGALTAKVKAALVAEPGISALAIDVESRDNVVTLHGTVDSETNRQRASTVASGVEGVKSVDNKLSIKAP